MISGYTLSEMILQPETHSVTFVALSSLNLRVDAIGSTSRLFARGSHVRLAQSEKGLAIQARGFRLPWE